jgi:dTDP-4-amino-4,6-dideoxygalactose transaminase
MSERALLPIIRPTLPDFDDWVAELRAVWESGMLTVSERGRRFEAAVAEVCGVEHAVSMSSCTSGLILLLASQNLPRGGEVIVPAFTFAATAHSVLWNGLVPVFADCDASTLTMDPDSARAAVTDKTVAILATTIFGTPPDLDRLQSVSDDAGLCLVLDSAQALGATWRGTPMGGFGVGEVFSFSPTKVATAAEAGVVTTHDGELAGLLRRYRDYGKSTDGQDMEFLGLSARLSELHAIVGLASVSHLSEYIAHRRSAISAYHATLADLPGVSFPGVPEVATTSANYMVLRVDAAAAPLSRDDLHARLGEDRIQTKKYFHPAVHLQTLYRGDGTPPSLPRAEAAADECLALPLFGHITPDQVDRVIDAVRAAFS